MIKNLSLLCDYDEEYCNDFEAFLITVNLGQT